MMMMLPVAILAGGLGTRLGALTEALPKCLIEIAGRPFLVHQLELLRRNGVEQVVLCLGHLGEMVQELAGDGRSFGLRLEYTFDGPGPLGTGGALKKAMPLLGDASFVLYGDSYLDIDYAAVQLQFEKSRKLGLMTVFRNQNARDTSNILFVQRNIVHYSKQTPCPEMQHIDYGLGILRHEVFSRVPSQQKCDLSYIYDDLIKRGQMDAFEVTQRFYEIGSPQGLEETRSHLSSTGTRERSFTEEYLLEARQTLE